MTKLEKMEQLYTELLDAIRIHEDCPSEESSSDVAQASHEWTDIVFDNIEALIEAARCLEHAVAFEQFTIGGSTDN